MRMSGGSEPRAPSPRPGGAPQQLLGCLGCLQGRSGAGGNAPSSVTLPAAGRATPEWFVLLGGSPLLFAAFRRILSQSRIWTHGLAQFVHAAFTWSGVSNPPFASHCTGRGIAQNFKQPRLASSAPMHERACLLPSLPQCSVHWNTIQFVDFTVASSSEVYAKLFTNNRCYKQLEGASPVVAFHSPPLLIAIGPHSALIQA